MKRLSAVTLSVFMASCASPPKVHMPDPNDRVPINTTETIVNYEEETSKITNMIQENERLKDQLKGLRKQVDELKVFILKDSQCSNEPRIETRKNTKPVSTLENYERHGSIETSDVVTKYTVNHPFSITEFLPPYDVAQQLAKTAQNARKVIIRGRTDASSENEIDRQIALDRALNAQDYLVNRCGVDIDRVRVFYLSAGDHIADNSNEEGKALNRRVEIETY